MDLIRENLMEPLLYGEGYNIYTTLFVALIFLMAFYLIWRLTSKLDQRKIRRALFPWMLAGGALRFLDPRIFHSILTRTPFIWFLIGIPALLFAIKNPEVGEKLGFFLFLIFLFLGFKFLKFSKILYAVAAILISFSLYFFISRIEWMDDKFAWLPHLFEAWITSFGVLAGLYEEHVLARAIMSINPLLFGLIKTMALIFIFYFLRDLKGEEKIYVGTAISALALGPCLRDLLELLSL